MPNQVSLEAFNRENERILIFFSVDKWWIETFRSNPSTSTTRFCLLITWGKASLAMTSSSKATKLHRYRRFGSPSTNRKNRSWPSRPSFERNAAPTRSTRQRRTTSCSRRHKSRPSGVGSVRASPSLLVRQVLKLPSSSNVELALIET
jgi:hypothetical protein